MATWKFSDDYLAAFPGLAESILAKLVFTEHTLSNGAFSGSLAVVESGDTLAVAGALLNATALAVRGTVDESGGVLKVSLESEADATFLAALAKNLPFIGGVTRSAKLIISTVIHSADASKSPRADSMTLVAVLTIGNHTGSVSAMLPRGAGYMKFEGAFQGVGLKLEDLEFLLSGAGGNSAWFPHGELGAYAPANGAALELLGVSLSLFVDPKPLTVKVTSATAIVGITKISVFEDKLYLNPLSVWVTVNRIGAKPQVLWGIGGTLMLTNHEHRTDLANPDLAFTFGLTLQTFSIAGHLENPKKQPLNVIVKDLLGPDKGIGISDKVVLEQLAFEASADKATGKIANYSAELGMSGGFGLLEKLEIESLHVKVAHRG